MTTPTPPRPTLVYLAGIFALLIGLVALTSAFVGLRGAGSFADNALAVPNLVTGFASVLGGIGFLLFRKWGVYAFAVSVLGHFGGHVYLVYSYAQIGRMTAIGTVQLAVIPLITLGILIAMERERRRGILT